MIAWKIGIVFNLFNIIYTVYVIIIVVCYYFAIPNIGNLQTKKQKQKTKKKLQITVAEVNLKSEYKNISFFLTSSGRVTVPVAEDNSLAKTRNRLFLKAYV